MKNSLRKILIIGIFLLLSVIYFIWLSSGSIKIEDVVLIKENIGLETSEIERVGSGATFSFPTRENNNETVSVRDFKNDPGVVEWGGKDTLVLGDGLIDNDPAFQIFYYDFDKSFSIAILQEPIGDIRKVAEVQLLERLQIKPQEACILRISVTVPSFVNEDISGQDLGLSFCPNAVQL